MSTAKPAAPKKVGRRSLYSDELAQKICDLIAEGKSEREICAMPGMPDIKTIWAWKNRYPEFLQQSVRARAQSAEIYNARRMEKAEALYREAQARMASGENFPKGVVEAIKACMQEDAREAAIRDDSRYGDRKKVALTGSDGGPLKTEVTHKIELSPRQKAILDKVLDDEY